MDLEILVDEDLTIIEMIEAGKTECAKNVLE